MATTIIHKPNLPPVTIFIPANPFGIRMGYYSIRQFTDLLKTRSKPTVAFLADMLALWGER